jgi:hypothetical protein
MSSQVVSQSLDGLYSRQGVEIKTYEDVFSTTLPRIMANGDSRIVVDGIVKQKNGPFDDGQVDKLNSNKKFFVPTHKIENRDLGRLKLFNDDTPFEEFTYGNATSYIDMQGDPGAGYQLIDLLYPYVLDTPGKIDPGSMDGVIEPLAIRDYATRQTIDRPESARRARASIASAHEDPFGYNVLIEQQKILVGYDAGIRPYLEYGDDSNRPLEQKMGYFAEDPTGKSPFRERTKELEFAQIVGEDFAAALSNSTTAFDDVGKTYISACAGYTFIDNENGTDSIAFLDQKGI